MTDELRRRLKRIAVYVQRTSDDRARGAVSDAEYAEFLREVMKLVEPEIDSDLTDTKVCE